MSHDQSELSLINGRVLPSEEFPEAVIVFNEVAGTYCTGVFINETQVLTAAHCTEHEAADSEGHVQSRQSILENVTAAANPDPSQDVKTVVATSDDMIRHPQWDLVTGLNDVMLINFPKGIAKGFKAVSTTVGKDGDPVVLVGAGRSIEDQRPSGYIRRAGQTTLTTKFEGFENFYHFEGGLSQDNSEGKNPSLAGGDSGGPLYLGEDLIGICVSHRIQTVFVHELPEQTRISHCTNLNADSVKSFLDEETTH